MPSWLAVQGRVPNVTPPAGKWWVNGTVPSGTHVPGSAAKVRMLRNSIERAERSGAQLPQALLAGGEGGRCWCEAREGSEGKGVWCSHRTPCRPCQAGWHPSLRGGVISGN